MRYRITVNQAKLKAGEPNVIHVHDSWTDERQDFPSLSLGDGVIRYDPNGGLADGSRVWIETEERPTGTNLGN